MVCLFAVLYILCFMVLLYAGITANMLFFSILRLYR